MSTCNWLSRAAARAQVSTLTPANVEIGDIFTATINGKSISVTATAATVANVTGLLTAAWNASTIPEFSEITAVDSTTKVTLTGDVAGVPFTVTASATDGGGTNTQTHTAATTTAATGPNHWNDANNWDGGAVPITGDDVNIDISLGSILYGLDQNAVTLATLYVFSSVKNQPTYIGLPKRNALGYTEYRDDYLKISATTHRFDTDSGRIKVNFGSVATAGDVLRVGNPAEQGIPAILLRGTSTSNAFEFVSGQCGIGIYDNETAAAATLKVNSEANVLTGPGVSIPAVTSTGQLDFRGTCATTFTINGGNAIKRGTTNTATMIAEGGVIDYRSSGNITTGVLLGGRSNGTVDCSKDLSARTFASVTYKKGGKLVDPHATVTQTAIVRDSSVSEMTAA